MKARVYTDTSVLGGCEDPEFRDATQELVAAFVAGEMIMVLSELTLRELEDAPEPVRRLVSSVPADHLENLPRSAETEELAAAYIEDIALAASMAADALHIAQATVARVDVLVSWNFKHIVNLRRIHAYNAVNLKRGYPLLEIRTPREVLENE
ncbi:MAG: PIN domain protein [Armatimonadetes bacterium]|nr:PIN domain protein [Armatimonadota bacterium]